MDLGLKGRVAVVTGSSQGIGKATAERFAREGARVAVTYCRHQHEAEALVAAMRANGTDACALFLDLGNTDSVRAAIDSTISRWGAVDILVNNAVEWSRVAELSKVPFEDASPSDWQALTRANVEGAYTAIQAVLPSMRRKGWGRILNVSAVLVEEGKIGLAWYGAAKAALHGLTASLAKEVGAAGILVNVVMPGFTLTENVTRRFSPEALAKNAGTVFIRRLPRADEVASVIVFLCSSENTLITGEIIRPTGGR